MFEGKTILVAPMDWGLGHASRCVPLIRQFSEKNKVILGVTPVTTSFLSLCFPGLPRVELPSYAFNYSRRGSQWLRTLLKLPALFRTISNEQNETERIVGVYGINVIISDNRYGVHHTTTTNIFLCHQVNLHLPFFSSLVNWLHRRQFSHFGEVWIPDYEDNKKRLASTLSDASFLRVKHRYVGPLSALADFNEPAEPKYDYLFLLSGPEPQRTILEEKLLGIVKGKNKKIVLVRGTPSLPGLIPDLEIQKDLCTGEELARLIKASRCVVCRSGYSTLMDLHALGKKEMILIPTPGQPEQEYLAGHWKKTFGARVVKQGLIESIAI